jgi:23S rRNA pseudouridine2605 synthase
LICGILNKDVQRSLDANPAAPQLPQNTAPITDSAQAEFAVARTIAQQEGNTLSTSTIPTADQLEAARRNHWHHNADPILTVNMLRDWLNTSGLVLFTPLAGQLPAPGPSFVEATLGAANAEPSIAETEQPRALLTRLILDGGAIPLNLLGSSTGIGTETPDFLVSPLAFPYVFTLRGDKAWKQPPTISGASKVSPLALNTFVLIADHAKDTGAGMTSRDLATQLGKEVTETAVLRALTELWQHLRVIPVPQPDGAATLWELTAARFTKQIKAGANAGQPSALSALISLYLGQAIVASEDEIETFLSPVASRSRIREVVRALLSARQLETVVIEGRTVLHISGELPVFVAATTSEPAHDDIDFLVVTGEGDPAADAAAPAESKERITKFIPKPRKVGTGFVTKTGSNFRDKPADRERRPFTRDSGRPPFEKKFEKKLEKKRETFNRPWDEERAASFSAGGRPSRVRGEAQEGAREAEPRTFDRKPSFNRDEKGTFGSKPRFGERPSFQGGKPSFKKERTGFTPREGTAERPSRREFTPRPQGGGFANDRPRKSFSKSGTFDRKREGFSDKREGFAGKPSFPRDREGRPPRRDSGDRPYKPAFKNFSGDRERRPARDEGRLERPPFRKFDAPRTPRRAFEDRPERPSRPARAEGGSSEHQRTPRGNFGAKKPFNKSGFSKSGFERGEKNFVGSRNFAGKSGGSFAKKPGGFAGKKTFGKPANTFDKFKGNKKPFGKRAPARKFKPEENKSSE